MMVTFPWDEEIEPGIRCCSIVLSGLLFKVYLYRPFAKAPIAGQIAQLRAIALQESGELVIPDMDIAPLIMGRKLQQRLLEKDVKAFYDKY